MSALILLIALILALVAGYFFLQWKCPSKKDKLQQTMEKVEDLAEEFDLNESETLTPTQIKELKTKMGERMKKMKELQKKKTDELNEEESKELSKLPALQEIQTLTQDIQKTEDFSQKVYGTLDYVYAGGIVVGVFLLSVWLVGKLFGLTKLGTEN